MCHFTIGIIYELPSWPISRRNGCISSQDGSATLFPPKGSAITGDRLKPFTVTRQQIMTIYPIVRYPDPRLALPAQPVTVFEDGLRDLARDLLETMQAAPGIGIAAPHIGISLRVVVLDLDPVNGARTYVNPEIT